MTRIALPLIAVMACGTGSSARSEDTDSLSADTALAEEESLDSLPDYPAYPSAQSGRLALVAVGGDRFDGAWPARAGRCSGRSMVLLLADGERSGASVLIDPGSLDHVVGSHLAGPPTGPGTEGPAAMLGVQRMGERGTEQYQAVEGAVEVGSFGDRMTGRFTVELRHVTNNVRVRAAGTFRDVPVAEAPPEWCLRPGEAADTAAG